MRAKQDYSLKDAKDDFRLWDKLLGRDILPYLEQVSKWEPGKQERQRRERLAALEAKKVSIFQLPYAVCILPYLKYYASIANWIIPTLLSTFLKIVESRRGSGGAGRYPFGRNRRGGNYNR